MSEYCHSGSLKPYLLYDYVKNSMSSELAFIVCSPPTPNISQWYYMLDTYQKVEFEYNIFIHILYFDYIRNVDNISKI